MFFLEVPPYPTLTGILSFSLIGLHSLCIKNITQRKAIIPPVNSNSCAIGYCDSGAGLAYLLWAVECQPPLRIIAASHSCHIDVTTQLGEHWPQASALRGQHLRQRLPLLYRPLSPGASCLGASAALTLPGDLGSLCGC